MKGFHRLTMVTVAFFILLGCGDTKNPYLESTGSGIRIVAKSFNDGDTVSIFSTESLTFVLHLKEHIDHISLSASANRYWPGNDTIITAAEFGREPFTFRYSFYDTGWRDISITAGRDRGDSAREHFRVYARSPLRQMQIKAEMGDTVLLSTPPVGDEALYVWDFRDGMTVKNNANHASYIVKTPLSAGAGELYVSDHSHRSPSAFFIIVVRTVEYVPGAPDTLPPQLVSFLGNGIPLCAGLVISDPRLVVRAEIFDNDAIADVSINGSAASIDSSGAWFIGEVALAHRLTGTVVHLVAIDITGNKLDKTFTVYLNRPPIFTQIPLPTKIPADSLFAEVLGVTDPDGDSVSLTAIIHGGGGDSLLPLDGARSLVWRPTPADTGWRMIDVNAWDGYAVTRTTLTVYVSPRYASAVPVRFSTSPADVPNSLIAVKDTLRVYLRTDPMSGTLPMRLSARVIGGPVLLDNSASPVALWAPSASDTGLRRIEFSVCDSLGFVDTIRTSIIVSPPAPVFVFFETSGTSAPESAPAIARVRLSAPSPFVIGVGLVVDTLLSTAQPADFQLPANRTILFQPGDTAASVAISIINDSIVEQHERLALRLTSPSAYAVIGIPAVHTHTIINDDFPLTIVISPVSSGTVLQTGAGEEIAGIFRAGAVIILTAKPSAGYRIGSWSGPVTATTDPSVVNVRMDSTMSVGVEFKMAPPVITVQPVDKNVTENQSTILGVTALGLNLGFQWQRNQTAIPAATNTTYSTPVLTLSDNGARYRCVVGNPGGSVASAEAAVFVAPLPPVITGNPRDTTILEGLTATFSVTATGSGLTYQWQKNGKLVSLATLSILTAPLVTVADSGAIFRCIVVNSAGSVSSQGAVLSVRPGAPAIATQPSNKIVAEGATATFSLLASGSRLSYQWQKNGSVISVATLPSYTTPAATMADSGAIFRCIVANSAGSVPSAGAVLSVRLVAPTIATQPSNKIVAEGATATFSLLASGSRLIYQWQKNGVAITSASLPTYTTPAAAVADSGAVFRCIVTNSAGTATSLGAVLSVLLAAPAITTQPSGQSVAEGATATFLLLASGSRLSYQWRKNTSDISGAAAASYTTPATIFADRGSIFTCIVRNGAGSITSTPAGLNVTLTPPVVITNPVDQTVNETQPATFTATIRGSICAYQWQKNGTDIPGAIALIYTISSTAKADSGSVFRLMAVNPAGTVATAGATLRVRQPLPVPVLPMITGPLPVSVVVNSSATFTVNVTGGTLPITYQWQRNTVVIPGATDSAYPIASVQPAQNGEKYRCVVTNPAGSVTSAAAILTVQ
jgi:hypothetical protein